MRSFLASARRHPRALAGLAALLVAAGVAEDVLEDASLLRWAGVVVAAIGIVALVVLLPALAERLGDDEPLARPPRDL